MSNHSSASARSPSAAWSWISSRTMVSTMLMPSSAPARVLLLDFRLAYLLGVRQEGRGGSRIFIRRKISTVGRQLLKDAARTRGVEASIYQVTKAEEIANAIDAAKSSGATALNVLASAMIPTYQCVRDSRSGRFAPPAEGFLQRHWPALAVRTSLSWSPFLFSLAFRVCNRLCG